MTPDTRTLEFFHEIARLAPGSDAGQSAGDHFLARLLDWMPTANAISLWLYFPESGEAKVMSSMGYNADTLREIQLPAGKSFGRPLSTGQAFLWGTPTDAARCINEMPLPQRALYRAAAGVEHPNSALAVPLQSGGTMLGVLVLENYRDSRQFTADQLKWVETAGGFAALALDNARLRNALRESEAAVAAGGVKKESIAFLAHEMRTPLTLVKGYATALLMPEIEFDASAKREFLEQIDRECDTLIRLIEDLLESSVLEAGQLELELQPVSIPALVNQVIDELLQATTRHRFVVEFPSGFPPVRADRTRLTQVVRNLLENAVKYSPGGGLIVVQGRMQPHQVVISIADQGIGIAPEHLNRLFEKFFRVKMGASKATIGSGLGLPIARSIVEAHGGHIWAESKLGQGSTFYVALPLQSGIEPNTAKVEQDE